MATEEDQRIISKYWIPFIFILVLWGFTYAIFDVVKVGTHVLFGIIFSDIQIIFIFITLLFVSIGWVFVEIIALITFTLRVHYQEQVHQLVKGIRIASSILLLICIIFNYVTIWHFNDWQLYAFSIGFTALICAIYFKSARFKRPTDPSTVTTYSPDFAYMYIPVQKIFLAAIISGLGFIFTIFYFTGTPWVVSIVDAVVMQIMVNPIIITLIILVLLFTIFFPLLQILTDLLANYCRQVLSTEMKERMKFIRKWTLILIIVVVLMRVVPFLDFIPDFIKPGISLAAMLLFYFITSKRNKSVYADKPS